MPTVSSQLIAQHERAVDSVIGGRWNEARGMLEAIAPSDGPSTFLRKFLAQSGDTPPADWDGTIRLETK